jgi:hypothetical protein
MEMGYAMLAHADFHFTLLKRPRANTNGNTGVAIELSRTKTLQVSCMTPPYGDACFHEIFPMTSDRRTG